MTKETTNKGEREQTPDEQKEQLKAGRSLFKKICGGNVEDTKLVLEFLKFSFTKAVLGAICGALGIEKIGDLNLKIESIKNDSPDGVRRLVDAIIADPVALSKLQRELNKDVQTPAEKAPEESKDSDTKTKVESDAKPKSKGRSAKESLSALNEFDTK